MEGYVGCSVLICVDYYARSHCCVTLAMKVNSWLIGFFQICIAMKFYEGSVGDKMARLKSGRLPLSDVLRCGEKAHYQYTMSHPHVDSKTFRLEQLVSTRHPL